MPRIYTQCQSETVVPLERQGWYDNMLTFFARPEWEQPTSYRKMGYGIQLITASAGIEMWERVDSNDVASDCPANYKLPDHKKMIDMIASTGADHIQIRCRYPDNAYVPGSSEALHGAIQYAQSKGLRTHIIFLPDGLEHIHVAYGNNVQFFQKVYDFIQEFVAVYHPEVFGLHGYENIIAKMGVDVIPLRQDVFMAVKGASPETYYLEGEGANFPEQVAKFKMMCDSPYNDIVGIPMHDMYSRAYVTNFLEMLRYAKAAGKPVMCPDAWLTDMHFDKPWEMMTNTGWRDPLDSIYMKKVIDLAQVSGLVSICMFYGNSFISYNPGFNYPYTSAIGYSSAEWIACLQSGSRTGVYTAYKNALADAGVVIPVESSSSILPVVGLGIGILFLLTKKKRRKYK